MKIHTTQNLDSIAKTNSTNNMALKEFRKNNYSERMHMRKQDLPSDTYENSVSFKGKKEIIPIINNAVKGAKRGQKMDKFLNSTFFNKCLDLMEHEVFVQSAISALVCMALRPATILALPNGKDKQDNIYASAHSISSGVVGILSSLLISVPFSKGIKFSKSNKLVNLNVDILKKMYPQIAEESIWKDASKTVRKPIEEWKDIYGNKFSTDFKNVFKFAKPKHISQVSADTLKTLGVDVDLAAMKGKSVNDWVDKNGNKIHLDLKDMFIVAKEEGMGTNYFSLKHIDKDFLKELQPNLDINTIEKDGKRLHPDFWKNIDGSDYKLDLDNIHISSYRETADAVPLYTGLKRTETAGKKEIKYVSYQKNGVGDNKFMVPEVLGSPIEQKYLDADAVNDIKFKLLGWIPDILTRPFVASLTIALIPAILVNIFHLEKSKKHAEPKTEVLVNNTPGKVVA